MIGVLVKCCLNMVEYEFLTFCERASDLTDLLFDGVKNVDQDF